MTIPQRKQALRRAVKARALSLSDEQLRRSDDAICWTLLALPELAAADTVFSYYPVAGEPDILPVLEELLARGKTLALPRCAAAGVMEARRVAGPSGLADLSPGRYGIPEPGTDCPILPWEAFSLAILPCVTADRHGNRLGHGGGYYDRFLAQAPRSMLSAVVCRSVLMPRRVPTQPHDIPAALVVTEDGLWRRGSFFPMLYNPGNSAKSNSKGTACPRTESGFGGADKTGG